MNDILNGIEEATPKGVMTVDELLARLLALSNDGLGDAQVRFEIGDDENDDWEQFEAIAFDTIPVTEYGRPTWVSVTCREIEEL
jgi:hypothetical protein